MGARLNDTYEELFGSCEEADFDVDVCYPSVVDLSESKSDPGTPRSFEAFTVVQQSVVLCDAESDAASSRGTVDTDNSGISTKSSRARFMRDGF